ncbi:MAG TPA: helix-turn-helix domain-containing protein [Candidatus Sulfopaludibacter sp.]|jgi:cytoskeleton protein RodZ|nr:helix-turn-helix domain-containing protein [Candidatus Sulfopaludibacter sp.]
MTSIGETLRRERLRRNLDLDQISRELKISPKLLEAIEAEQFEKLPGSVFAKSFVRQYAHFLGLDEEEMAAEVQRTLQPPADVPRFVEAGKPLAAPIQVPKVEEWETVGDRGFSWSSPLTALALFVVAMLVCSGVYAWYQKTRQTVLARNPAVVQQSVPAAQLPPPPAVVEQPAAQQPPPQEAATPSATPSQTAERQAPPPAQPAPAVPNQSVITKVIPTSNPNAPVRVQITATEPSWVLVKGDGKYIFSGTLDANQTRSVDGARMVEVRLGNAGGVSIVLNGTSIGTVGPKGQVRTVQLTSGGFQIVAAPKSAPLLDPL